KLLANALFESEGPTARTLAEAEKSIAILAPLPPVSDNADTWRRAATWYMAKGDPPSLARALVLLQRCRAIVAAQADAARALPTTPADDPIFAAPADVDRMIAGLQLRLGNGAAALDTASRAVDADPSNPAAWSQYADALALSGRTDDALAALMEGVLLTADPALRRRVVEGYQHGAPGGCALLPGQNGSPALNPACPEVHRYICLATARAIALRLRAGRSDLAAQLRDAGLHSFGCDAASLDPASPPPSTAPRTGTPAPR
ncbi:MAG: tetratricopeptide repeat protein, partial [Acidobacteriota bacterium]|nr:tetratricopeptide repeat protein [Acidobacteriota bacterium]